MLLQPKPISKTPPHRGGVLICLVAERAVLKRLAPFAMAVFAKEFVEACRIRLKRELRDRRSALGAFPIALKHLAFLWLIRIVFHLNASIE